ncbi:Transcription factor bHLH106 [Linum grandiflorum]
MQHPAGDNYWMNDSSTHSYLFRLLAAENGSSAFQQHHPLQASLINIDNQIQAASSSCDYSNDFYHHHQFSGGGSGSVITAGENSRTTTPQDRAYQALQNHKEAEKRRRERINSHLDKLRALLPCNSKTDKASLLAKVVERVKELKQQTSEIQGLETFPSEVDEITVAEEYGERSCRMVYKASVCCEDRSELLPELMEIFKSLHLKTVRAEMVTLGGRTRSVLMVAPAEDHAGVESIHFLQAALKSLLERSNNSSGAAEPSKRRRLFKA